MVVGSSSGAGHYTVLVAPWGNPRENICECAGYFYRAKCQHQEKAMDLVCGWTEKQQTKDKQSAEQRASNQCPRCGGETLWRMDVEEEE